MPMASNMQVLGYEKICSRKEKDKWLKIDGTKLKLYSEKFVFLQKWKADQSGKISERRTYDIKTESKNKIKLKANN
jgi:hypothetical protein